MAGKVKKKETKTQRICPGNQRFVLVLRFAFASFLTVTLFALTGMPVFAWQALQCMFQEKIDLNEPKQKINCIHYIPGIMIYDYSDVHEMDDIAEWHMGKGAA